MRKRFSELTLLLMVCFAPWAFGSVEAWAELGLYGAIGLMTVLGHGPRRLPRSTGLLVRLPSMALTGLVLLAVFQAMPLGRGVLSLIAPSAAAHRAALLPERPEQVAHASSPAVSLPAATLSIDPDSSLQTAARLAAAWLLFHCVLGMKDDVRAFALFAKVVVFNSALLALFAIIQALTWNGQIYWYRPVMAASAWSVGGPFVSHNHLAAYLNLGLGLALGRLLRGSARDPFRRDPAKLWTAYAAGIIAICVVTSHSRSGFLGLLAACLVLAIFLRGRLIRMGLGLAVVLVISGLFLALLSSSSSYGARLMTILDLGDEGYQARIGVWEGAVQAWWERPIWGSGLGSFPVAIMPHLTRELTVFFARAENEYVDMVVEGGVVGLFLVFAFMVGIAGLALRALRAARGKREPELVLGTAFGLIALAVQSCADFGSHIPAVGVTAVVFCGFIARWGSHAGSRQALPAVVSPRSIYAGQIDRMRRLAARLDFGSHIPAVRATGGVFRGVIARWSSHGRTRQALAAIGSLRSLCAGHIDRVRGLAARVDFGSSILAVRVWVVIFRGFIARWRNRERTRQALAAIGTLRLLCAGQIDRVRGLAARLVPRGAASGWLASELSWLGCVLLAAALIAHGMRDAWIEDRLARGGLPSPGTLMPTVGTLETTTLGLDDWRDALQDAVRRRPNWAEGYLRLGLVHLGLYRQQAKEWLEDSGVDPNEIARMAEPVWLLGALHDDAATTAEPPSETDALTLGPIRDHLVPAVSCFLEARRCCPFLALSHAELASLNELLVRGEPASSYATRALRLSGNDGALIGFLAQVAVQSNDRGLAARCWRKKLKVNPSSWPEVADDAVTVLSADELLSDVVPDGRHAVRFAERLYTEADQQNERDQFLQAAIARLPVDQEISAAERFLFEAHASAGLNLREQACERMEAALELQPDQSDWRRDYVDWLLRWGRADDAHKHALIGKYFAPDSKVFQAAIERTAEALARGGFEK